MRRFALLSALLSSLSFQHLIVVGLPFTQRSTSPSAVNQAKLNGATYTNKGLVAFGLIRSDFRESTGDTLGGIGSAISLKPNTWQSLQNGSYVGTLYTQPDRGFNVDETINYQARVHEIDFMLTPYYGSKNLDFETAQSTLSLTYKNTALQFDRNGKTTSGLDPTSIRKGGAYPGDPELPIVSDEDDRLVLDVEGMVANPDGTFWISDEYGPYIYRFSGDGQLLTAVQPPDAILPRDSSENINFTSVDDPKFGRTSNQGLESLTMDPETHTLYAMLQSAAIQDGGDDKETSRHTRLLGYDVSDPSKPKLIGEWVVPLPVGSNDKTKACSEIQFVTKNIFLALSRDGDGRGGDDKKSSYKSADLFSIKDATDIHGTKFDDHSNPIAKKGKLDKKIRPAEYVSFVNFIDSDQLARMGLHNGAPDDQTLLNSKWESLALAPVDDPENPDDYFLIAGSDNDFLSTHGVSLGIPFDAGLDVDNQFMVFRITLPGASIKV